MGRVGDVGKKGGSLGAGKRHLVGGRRPRERVWFGRPREAGQSLAGAGGQPTARARSPAGCTLARRREFTCGQQLVVKNWCGQRTGEFTDDAANRDPITSR